MEFGYWRAKMNADPALPVSTGNDAGVFQKLNSKSSPDEPRRFFRNSASHTGKHDKRIFDAPLYIFVSNIPAGNFCPAAFSRNIPVFTCTGGK